jgi:hypothetical protein
MSTPGLGPYVDANGRSWHCEKLDRLLDDPAVLHTVHETRRVSLDAGGRLRPGAAFAAACSRYKREECGALLHMLVVRLQDREDEDAHA